MDDCINTTFFFWSDGKGIQVGRNGISTECFVISVSMIECCRVSRLGRKLDENRQKNRRTWLGSGKLCVPFFCDFSLWLQWQVLHSFQLPGDFFNIFNGQKRMNHSAIDEITKKNKSSFFPEFQISSSHWEKKRKIRTTTIFFFFFSRRRKRFNVSNIPLIKMIKIVMMIGRTQGVGTSISWKN